MFTGNRNRFNQAPQTNPISAIPNPILEMLKQPETQQQIMNNPIYKIASTDQTLLNSLKSNPKNFEQLVKNKLESIGLTAQEMAIMYMRYIQGLNKEQALEATGLAEEDLNKFHDEAMRKINNKLSPQSVFGDIGNLFKK